VTLESMVDYTNALLCLQETHLSSLTSLARLFPDLTISCSCRADGWGGIATVIPPCFNLVSETCTAYYVGTLLEDHNTTTRFIVLNFYIPPVTSPYAPRTYR